MAKMRRRTRTRSAKRKTEVGQDDRWELRYGPLAIATPKRIAELEELWKAHRAELLVEQLNEIRDAIKAEAEWLAKYPKTNPNNFAPIPPTWAMVQFERKKNETPEAALARLLRETK